MEHIFAFLWQWKVDQMTKRATPLRRVRCAVQHALGIIPTTNKTGN